MHTVMYRVTKVRYEFSKLSYSSSTFSFTNRTVHLITVVYIRFSAIFNLILPVAFLHLGQDTNKVVLQIHATASFIQTHCMVFIRLRCMNTCMMRKIRLLLIINLYMYIEINVFKYSRQRNKHYMSETD